MNLILLLLLAHFIADFPLQSYKLIKWKQRSFWGILAHTSIHLIVMLALTAPFLSLYKVKWGIALIFVSHNIIDYAKIVLQKRYPGWHPFILYALDQAAHILVIFWIAYGLLGQMPSLPDIACFNYYSDPTLIGLILILVLVTFFYDVTRWTLLYAKPKKSYKRDYRMMIRNSLIVVIAFGLYWFLG